MTLDDILPFLLADVPQCPDPTAKLALIQAAQEFCEFTHAWREVQDPFTLIDTQHTYDIDVPAGAQVAAVIGMWNQFGALKSRSIAQIERQLPNWTVATGSTPLYYNSAPSSSQVRVYPTPLNANRARLTMRVAYKPTLTATDLPDAFVNDYLESLLSGARARLMLQPGRPWSNPQLGAIHGERFEADKVDTRVQILHDNTPGTMTAHSTCGFGQHDD